MKKGVLAALCALLLLLSASALAGPAYPGVIEFAEAATGEIVQIYNCGDEFFSYMTDTEGRLLVVDGAGYLRRVVTDGKSYALGGYATQSYTARAIGEEVTQETVAQDKLQALRNTISAAVPKEESSGDRIGDIPANYDFAGDAAEGYAQICDTDEDEWLDDVSNYPEKESTCALLVLHVEFENLPAVYSDEDWHNRVFEGGISGYYSTVSNGKFTYAPVRETAGTANDGVVTVTLPFDAPLYVQVGEGNQNIQDDPEAGIYRGSDGKNYAIYNMGSIYAYALLQARDSIDFAAYDRNGDGYISPTELAVLVVYTGYEASYGGNEACEGKSAVWAHSWKYNNVLSTGNMEDYHYATITVDGKKLSKYTVVGELPCTPEEYDLFTKTGTPRQAQFGTASHELGHDLGLPDLYPTGGAQTSQTVGYLSLMASGSWGTADGDEPGSSPVHLDPLSKLYLGFYDAETVSADGVYTLYATEPSSQYNILRINTDNPDVYYLLENRENTGLDQGLQRLYPVDRIGGIVIWRIDEEVLQRTWRIGGVNDTDGNYGNMPVFATLENGAKLPFWSYRLPQNDFEKLRENQLPVLRMSLPDAAMTMELGTGEAPLSIVRQPQDAYVTVGQRAAFSVEARGDNLNYRWYVYSQDDFTWQSIPGAESAEFLTAEATLQDNGTMYRCMVLNTEGYIMTQTVTLYVREADVPPETGDDSAPLKWLAMCLLGGAGLGLLCSRRRKRT